MSITRHFPPDLTRILLGRQDRVELHDHDRHQLLYPTRGVISTITRDGTWIIPPHRAIWLPAGCPHRNTAHGSVELCSVLLPAAASPLDTGRPTLLAVSPLLREVIRALTGMPRPSAGERVRLEAVVFDQLRPSPAAAAHLLPQPRDDRLAAIAAALRREPGDTRTLAEFGRAVGASERTLSRLFRAGTGMSFPQWRAQLRLQAALIDLAAGIPVSATAYRCGYSTPSTFIAAFRHAFGITPGAYTQELTSS